MVCKFYTVKQTCNEQVEESYLSEPENIEFPTEGGLTAYMNYYRPRNDHFRHDRAAQRN